MKKHFLFLSMFALTSALSYGQQVATTGSAPTPVTCPDNDPLNPIIGKEYTYKGTGSPTGGTYHIFATNSTNFIQNGALVTTGAYTTGNQITTTDASYNVGTNNNGEVKLAWTGAAANPSFVAIQYKTPTGACTTDNLKVYKITPKNAFTIELRNMENAGGTFTTKTTNVDVCSANVQSATYNTGTDRIEYDYGKQSFYYELIAANYDKTFEAKFKLSGLQTGQSAKLKWGTDKTAITNDLGNIISDGAEVTVTVTADSNVTPSAGVSIYLELEVTNGTYEGTTDKPITLSADATTGANNLKDVKTDCSDEDDFADKAIQTLKARPAIAPNTGTQFIGS
ncbi:MAG: hypothetical protein Q3983_07005 [Capnocytophaga sp.]|nr:hypothetical protein [Capnocytophaga sp.]